MSRSIYDSELNELTHMVADYIESRTGITFDRCQLNDKLSALCNAYQIEIVEDK